MRSQSSRLFPSGDKLIDLCFAILVASAAAAVVFVALTDYSTPDGLDIPVPENARQSATVGDADDAPGSRPGPAAGPVQRLLRSIDAAPREGAIVIEPGEYPGPWHIDKAVRIYVIAGVARIGSAYGIYRNGGPAEAPLASSSTAKPRD